MTLVLKQHCPQGPPPPLTRAVHGCVQQKKFKGNAHTVQRAVSILFRAVDVEDPRLHVSHQAGVVLVLLPHDIQVVVRLILVDAQLQKNTSLISYSSHRLATSSDGVRLHLHVMILCHLLQAGTEFLA